MSAILQESLRRLTLQPTTVCRSCKRTLTASYAKKQKNSPTSNLYQSFQDSLTQFDSKSSASSTRRAQTVTASPIAPVAANTSADPQNSQQAAEQGHYSIAIASAQESGRHVAADKRAQDLANLERTYSREDLDKQVQRKWRAGDVYAPHDLSGIEMAKWKKLRRKPRPKSDALDLLGMNPLHHYKNFSIMHEYMTETGRIKPSSETGLRPVNQRRMAKAIRRAIGLGLIPSTYKHPEILKLGQRGS